MSLPDIGQATLVRLQYVSSLSSPSRDFLASSSIDREGGDQALLLLLLEHGQLAKLLFPPESLPDIDQGMQPPLFLPKGRQIHLGRTETLLTICRVRSTR